MSSAWLSVEGRYDLKHKKITVEAARSEASKTRISNIGDRRKEKV